MPRQPQVPLPEGRAVASRDRGDREGALRLHFPGPMAWSASADGEMPKFGPKRKVRGLCAHPLMPKAMESGNEDAEVSGWVCTGWGWVSGASLCDPRRCLPGPVRAHIVKQCSAAQTRPSRPYPRPAPALAALSDLEQI